MSCTADAGIGDPRDDAAGAEGWLDWMVVLISFL
jgi:hypothetical protein